MQEANDEWEDFCWVSFSFSLFTVTAHTVGCMDFTASQNLETVAVFISQSHSTKAC